MTFNKQNYLIVMDLSSTIELLVIYDGKKGKR